VESQETSQKSLPAILRDSSESRKRTFIRGKKIGFFFSLFLFVNFEWGRKISSFALFFSCHK